MHGGRSRQRLLPLRSSSKCPPHPLVPSHPTAAPLLQQVPSVWAIGDVTDRMALTPGGGRGGDRGTNQFGAGSGRALLGWVFASAVFQVRAQGVRPAAWPSCHVGGKGVAGAAARCNAATCNSYAAPLLPLHVILGSTRGGTCVFPLHVCAFLKQQRAFASFLFGSGPDGGHGPHPHHLWRRAHAARPHQREAVAAASGCCCPGSGGGQSCPAGSCPADVCYCRPHEVPTFLEQVLSHLHPRPTFQHRPSASNQVSAL